MSFLKGWFDERGKDGMEKTDIGAWTQPKDFSFHHLMSYEEAVCGILWGNHELGTRGFVHLSVYPESFAGGRARRRDGGIIVLMTVHTCLGSRCKSQNVRELGSQCETEEKLQADNSAQQHRTPRH